MKDGAKEIVGKQIDSVIVAENASRDPKQQLFLLFDDGTYFEMYGTQFNVAGGVDRGDSGSIAAYVERAGGEIKAAYVKQAMPAKIESSKPIILKRTMLPSAKTVLWSAYWLGNLGTFVKLTFLSGYQYNAWNWLIVVPINEFLALIWPIYWSILYPLLGR